MSFNPGDTGFMLVATSLGCIVTSEINIGLKKLVDEKEVFMGLNVLTPW